MKYLRTVNVGTRVIRGGCVLFLIAVLIVIGQRSANAGEFNVYSVVSPTNPYYCASHDVGAVILHVAQGNQPNGPYTVLGPNGNQWMAGDCEDGICSNNDALTLMSIGGSICNEIPNNILFDAVVTTPNISNTGGHIVVKKVDVDCECAPPCEPCFFLGESLIEHANITLGTSVPTKEHLTEDDKKRPRCPNREPMAQYSVHEMLVSLNIEDTPFRYSPPAGPAIDFTVTYNEKTRQQAEWPNFSNFGTKWTCNWLGYVNDDPNFDITLMSVYLPGGGTELHNLDINTGESQPDPQSHATLKRTGSSSYERRLPDGTVQYFSHADDANAYPRRVLLTKITDSANNSVLIGYGSHHRVRTITDALGQVTKIGYNDPSDGFKITHVTEVLQSGADGRHAEFHYANGKLEWIRDEIGIVSSFLYRDGTDSIEYMTTPYGTTHFEPGHDSTGRWIVITDPEGKRERVEYRDQADIPVEGLNTVPSGFTSAELNLANSFYWDKKATEGVTGSNYDYGKARITHWAKYPDGTVSGIVASERAPLENRVWFAYDGQSDTNHTGVSASPIKIARVVDAAGTPQVWQYTYNGLGRVTSSTGPDPYRRVMTYSYYNDIDLHEIRQQTGSNNELIHNFENYESHNPHDEYDAAGQHTHYEYTSRGQMRLRRNPRLEETIYDYGGSAPDGYLEKITSPSVGGVAKIMFSYDDNKRVKTVTNIGDGYTVTVGYDDLDRVTQLTYLDGTAEHFGYSQIFPPYQEPQTILDLTTSSDRLNRPTTRHYNRNRQMDSITDPVGTTNLAWCGCGSLESITDPDQGNHVTHFYRDLQGRLTQKLFADGTTIDYLYEGQAGPGLAGTTSRLASVTDALGRRTKYAYYLDDDIHQISYTDTADNPLIPPTAGVSYTYDPNYNRISTMTDATGQTEYHYYPIEFMPSVGAGQLRYIDGPLANDRIDFTYDQLGRIESRSVNFVPETVYRDALGRSIDNYNVLGHFHSEYDGVSPRLGTVTYPSPNNQTTTYSYYGAMQDMRLQTIRNASNGGGNLSRFDYGYDGAQDQITSWSKLLGSTASGLWFGYDNANQLLSARNAANPNSTTLQLEYAYDDAGNRISDRNYNPNDLTFLGQANSYAINALNQVTTRTATSGGSGLQPQAFVYDSVGNMSSDGAGKTFEWDAANRLVAINYLSSGNRTEFAYDGLGRRVKIIEYGPGVTAEVEPPADGYYASFTTGKFTLPAGWYTITLQGLNPNGGDNTVLVDSVKLNNVLVSNGSFESPTVNDYQVAPTGAVWSFSGTAGVANVGFYMSGDPPAPDGSQVAFVRKYGSISRSLSLSVGTYKLDFKAAQRRGNGNESSQRLRVTFRSSAAIMKARTFVWCGNKICEERDATGANVTKRFFAEGEQQIIEGVAVNYFYTRDHLGSIREVTDSGGSMVAQYDYDPYGNRVVLSGQMVCDFGYTGHYFHAQSGLNLTLYRAYNPALGRWLSRDPLRDAELRQGVNLYAYTTNDPVNRLDPLGLYVPPPGPIHPIVWPLIGWQLGWVIGNTPVVRDFVDRIVTNTLYRNQDELKPNPQSPQRQHPNFNENWRCQREAEQRLDNGEISLLEYSEALRECNRQFPLCP